MLVISDIFILTGFGLIAPIFAIYVNDSIAGGSIFMAGIASTIFFATKSLVQLPFSTYVDKHDNKHLLLLIGTLLTTLTPFIYMLAKDISIIFLAQVIYGIGAGLSFPTWMGIWTTHLDKKQAAFEWSLYSTAVSIGTGTSAAIGAAVADYLGFYYTFLMVAMLSVTGLGILFWHSKELAREADLVQ